MDAGIETIILLDDEAVRPVTLSGEVSRLCRQGDQATAMVMLAQAIERLACAGAVAGEIEPRVEAVLRAWGYVPLVDLPVDPLPDDLTPRAPAP